MSNLKRSRVLVLDIETAPILVWTWGIKDQHISVGQIHKDWHIMAWCGKWLDSSESSYMYYDCRRTPGEDKNILLPLWDALNEADYVLTQNGKEFDAKKINARFMLHGMAPPNPYRHIDTYQIVKSVASFTSNTLEYLTNKFCKKFKKTSHAKFPGWSLWIECLKGNQDAWNEMKRYNIRDVLSTEELYNKIKGWAPETTPKVFEFTDASRQCGTCGFEGPMIEGKVRRAKTYKYKQHQCGRCGSWQKGEKIKSKDGK